MGRGVIHPYKPTGYLWDRLKVSKNIYVMDMDVPAVTLG